jgi:Arf/Sar family protein
VSRVPRRRAAVCSQGLNVKIMKKEGVTFKVWDIGGQVQYREEWPRYARGCDVIAFVVDTQKPELVPSAKKELHQLLEARELQKVPLLILANKIDLGQKITEQELIRALNLDYISDNSWLVIPISAKTGANIDQALEFLISKSHA